MSNRGRWSGGAREREQVTATQGRAQPHGTENPRRAREDDGQGTDGTGLLLTRRDGGVRRRAVAPSLPDGSPDGVSELMHGREVDREARITGTLAENPKVIVLSWHALVHGISRPRTLAVTRSAPGPAAHPHPHSLRGGGDGGGVELGMEHHRITSWIRSVE